MEFLKYKETKTFCFGLFWGHIWVVRVSPVSVLKITPVGLRRGLMECQGLNRACKKNALSLWLLALVLRRHNEREGKQNWNRACVSPAEDGWLSSKLAVEAQAWFLWTVCCSVNCLFCPASWEKRVQKLANTCTAHPEVFWGTESWKSLVSTEDSRKHSSKTSYSCTVTHKSNLARRGLLADHPAILTLQKAFHTSLC